MASRTPSEKSRPVLETAVQQSMLHQAQAAAAAAQTDTSRISRDNTPLPEADLLTLDSTEDSIPPPAYGEIYGEIRDEKHGLGGTSARVTDDGRVNIRINQLNRRFSQIFTPALRQQIQSVQDSQPPPVPYIPASLGGDKNLPPPPPLNVVIQIVGSRGDVQPFVALGKVLKNTYGHRVRLATHPTFKDFVQEHGLEFFSIGGDPSRLMAFMVKNPRLMPGFRTLMSGDIGERRKDVAEYIQGCWRSCYEAGDGLHPRTTDDDPSEPAARPFVADCIIANPPSFAHVHCAEKLGMPLHIMFTMPYSPTQAFPHPLANIQSSNADPQLTNYLSYAMIEVLSWQGLGDIINRFRAKCLGLDPVSMIWAPGMLHRLRIPHTYCWSPALIPKPKDWGPHISIAGFYLLDSASDYTPPDELQAFLDAGLPPVYIGFGSIVLDDPDAMTELIFEAVRKTGQRVLLSKGWGGMGADSLQIPEGVFILGNVPHDWLFQHVSCVVHHGGAGTTAAGITAGRPTVVVPFFGDQPFWGQMVARARAGPDPIPHKQLTAEGLANAINFCLKPETVDRAKELARKIAAERGSDAGAQSFHQYLEVDRLRCMLVPSRAAVWRVKRTQVRLSAFAACTLANAKLLDFHDLKLLRSQEYQTDEGPWDPVSGGAAACFRAFSGMMMGLAEVPSETVKPLQRIPRGSSRQQSRESLPTIAGKSETSVAGDRSTPLDPVCKSQTSLSVQESLTRIRSPHDSSDLTPATSKIESSLASNELQRQSNSTSNDVGTSRVHSRSGSSLGKDHDMLRRGVHTSKGFGRIMKASFQAPMEITVGLTKGFHNFPKLWGDDTVRPQEKISGFKSGAVAAGKEFGYGMYDGFSGLVTQPWRGAQKEGAVGFAKGFGKGIGGFATKPFAAMAGILGHTMKGVHKEMQKLFGNNVQTYIVSSRVAQGYEEWLQSSDEEKQDVVARWKVIQKYIKDDRSLDEMMKDALESHRKQDGEDAENQQERGYTSSSAQPASVNVPNTDTESATPARGVPLSLEGSLRAVEADEIAQLASREMPRRYAEDDTDTEQTTQLQQRQESADDHMEQENLRQAIAASEKEAQRHVTEARDEKRQLKRAMAQSLREERQRGGEIDHGADIIADEEDDGEAGESSSLIPPYPYDAGHLAGTRQDEFEAQRQTQRTEKTAQEKTEEEIVLEYIKKQSLLESQHRNKGKGHAAMTGEEDDDDDEDLQKAIKLSLHSHELDAENR